MHHFMLDNPPNPFREKKFIKHTHTHREKRFAKKNRRIEKSDIFYNRNTMGYQRGREAAEIESKTLIFFPPELHYR